METPTDQDPFLKHTSKVLTPQECSQLTQSTPSYHSIVQSIWPGVRIEGTEKCVLELEPYLSEFTKQKWTQLHENRGAKLQDHGFVSDEQRHLFALLSNYKNVLYPMRQHPTKLAGFDVDPVLDALVVHAVDHVLRSKSRLNLQITRRKTQPKRKLLEDRDLGFTQPKVLFLVPMRNKAYNVVSRILELGPPDTQQGLEVVKEKLMGSYGPDEDLERALKRQKKDGGQKPIDHESVFYGHVSDSVNIGIRVHLNGEFSFFRSISESDFIVASPLSLAVLIEKGDQKTIDALSSIEVLIVDWMDVILMQNWMHLMTVLDQLNKLPKESVGNVHLTQVRSYFLEEQGKHYRQTILCSAFLTAEMVALFNNPMCSNHAGKVKFRSWYKGPIKDLKKRPILRFERFDCENVHISADRRFEYFKGKVLSRLRDSNRFGLVLFISQYFDFGRVCEVLKNENFDFAAISEYSGISKITKLRKQFKNQKVRILVVTERAYFYHRPVIHGIKELVFYSLPEHPQFFLELLKDTLTSILILYSRFCVFQMERIVGTETTTNLITTAEQVTTLM